MSYTQNVLSFSIGSIQSWPVFIDLVVILINSEIMP
jgi:hypothetical protein